MNIESARSSLHIYFVSFLGLLAVSLSSFELTKYAHGTILNPWDFSLLTLFTTFIFLFSVFLVQWRSRINGFHLTYFLLLISSGIYFLRFPILDEVIFIAAAFGIFISALTSTNTRPSFIMHSTWKKIFCLWLFYLSAMSIVGFLYTGNIKTSRFLVIYLSMLFYFIFLFFYSRQDFKADPLRLILITGLTYYIMNFASIAMQISVGFFQEVFEGIGSAGSAYQNFISIVIIPTAFLSLSLNRNIALAISAIIFGTIIGVVGDSRSAVIPMLLCGLIALVFSPSFKLYTGVLLVIIFTSVAGAIAYDNAYWMWDTLMSIVSAFDIGGLETKIYYGEYVVAGKGDTGRFAYAISPLMVYLNNPFLALSGMGTYSYYPIAYESFLEILELLNSPDLIINTGYSLGGISEPPRPPAFGAYIIEYGLIGIFFFTFCFFKTIKNIFTSKLGKINKKLHLAIRLYLFAIPLCAIVWTYFGEVQDIIFFYIIFSPIGPSAMILSYLDKEYGYKA